MNKFSIVFLLALIVVAVSSKKHLGLLHDNSFSNRGFLGYPYGYNYGYPLVNGYYGYPYGHPLNHGLLNHVVRPLL